MDKASAKIKDPAMDIAVCVGAERARTLWLDHPRGIGRPDTTQVNMAYYGSVGWWGGDYTDE